ncbi:hypothetical protein D3C86_2063030 [compost metagenome]
MRHRAQRVPEKDQHINLARRDEITQLLVAAYRAAHQRQDGQTRVGKQQVSGGAGGVDGVALKCRLISDCPVEQVGFAGIVSH